MILFATLQLIRHYNDHAIDYAVLDSDFWKLNKNEERFLNIDPPEAEEDIKVVKKGEGKSEK